MAKISEIMSTDVQVIAPSASLQEAASLMKSIDVGALPVCEGESLVGVVTDRDIAVRGVAAALGAREARVSEVMTDEVTVCRSADDAASVMRLMGERQVRRLPVVDGDGKLVGIVSLADLAREQSAGKVGETVREISEPNAVLM